MHIYLHVKANVLKLAIVNGFTNFLVAYLHADAEIVNIVPIHQQVICIDVCNIIFLLCIAWCLLITSSHVMGGLVSHTIAMPQAIYI